MLLHNLSEILTIIEIQGADSKLFLQGQLTNDINLLDNQPFQFSAHLNNKGRILATFIITKIADGHYYLITSTDVIEKIIPRLKMFVLRSKVTINKSDLYIIYSDDKPNFVNTLEVIPGHFIGITNTLHTNILNNTTHWVNVLIEYGIPIVHANTAEVLIPQHINYDLIGGVSFTKGCYTGQEIVARTHYLGKVKRQMFKFICDSQPQIGQQVFSPNFDNQEVGIVIDFVKRDCNYLGLVSQQITCIDSAYLDKANTQQLLIQTIQY